MKHLPFIFHLLSFIFCLSLVTGCLKGDLSSKRFENLALTQKGDLSFRFVLSFGSVGSAAGEFLDPGGISLDHLGNVYVADTGNDRLQKFDSSGRFLFQTGSFGWDLGQFNKPTDVCARTSLEIYVVDSQNRRVQIFDGELNFLAEVTQAPNETRDRSGQGFGYLAGIGASSYGDVYVTDIENDRLVKISPFGRGERSFGEGRLFNPSGVAVGEEENVYVCDSGNNRIAVFDRFGGFLFSFGQQILFTPEGIDISPTGLPAPRWARQAGMVFVADTGHHRVVIFNKDGRVLQDFGTRGSGIGSFETPRDVAVDRRGFLYVLDSGNSRVQKFRIGRKQAR